MEKVKDDLSLKELEQFTGTEQYHKGFLGVLLTDGVYYISENGYSWFVTDAISVIKTKLKDEPFLTVNLKVDKETNKGIMTIDDGNGKILHKQFYSYTDASRNIKLFYTDNVLMLAGEY